MSLRWKSVRPHSIHLGGNILERIRYPVRDERGDTPFARMPGHRIEIFVRPIQSSTPVLNCVQLLKAYHLLLPSAKADLG